MLSRGREAGRDPKRREACGKSSWNFSYSPLPPVSYVYHILPLVSNIYYISYIILYIIYYHQSLIYISNYYSNIYIQLLEYLIPLLCLSSTKTVTWRYLGLGHIDHRSAGVKTPRQRFWKKIYKKLAKIFKQKYNNKKGPWTSSITILVCYHQCLTPNNHTSTNCDSPSPLVPFLSHF